MIAPMTTAMSPMMAEPTSPMSESVWVTMQAIEMHVASAITSLTAGSVAILKRISIVGGRIKD